MVQPFATSQSGNSRLPVVRKQKELFLCLKRASSHTSSANLHSLRELHGAYPTTLRTTESYNLLIGCAIRQEKYDDARYLFQEMIEADCVPNVHTWRLKVRFYMAEGYPELAYRCVVNSLHPRKIAEIPKPRSVPFGVWVEMLKPASRRSGCAIKPGQKQYPPSLTGRQASEQVLPNECPVVPFKLVFAPDIFLSKGSFTQRDYRAVADVVAYLHSQGRRDAALRTTFAWVSSLPDNITTQHNMRAFHIINQNLHGHHPNSPLCAKGHKAIVQMVSRQVNLILQLHGTHQQLRPPSFSIKQLLTALRRLRNPAKEVAVITAKLETVWKDVLDFEARVVALDALLKDQAPYRLASLVKKLIREQDNELTCRATADPSHANLAYPPGPHMYKYFALKTKARRLGVVRSSGIVNIRKFEAG